MELVFAPDRVVVDIRLEVGRIGDSHPDVGVSVGEVAEDGALTGLLTSAAVLLTLPRVWRVWRGGDPEGMFRTDFERRRFEARERLRVLERTRGSSLGRVGFEVAEVGLGLNSLTFALGDPRIGGIVRKERLWYLTNLG